MRDKTYKFLERIASRGDWIFTWLVVIWAFPFAAMAATFKVICSKLRHDRWQYKGWYEKLVPMDQWNAKKTCPQCHKPCKPNLTWCSPNCELDWKEHNTPAWVDSVTGKGNWAVPNDTVLKEPK